MYWTIDESPKVDPDIEGKGLLFPSWRKREDFRFKADGIAQVKVTKHGFLSIIDPINDCELFRVTRDAIIDSCKRGTRIYRYSDWIGPLLITITAGPGAEMSISRELFFAHRDKALELYAEYDRENAKIVRLAT